MFTAFVVLVFSAIALFEIPSGRRYEQGSLGERIYAFTRGPLRRLWKRVRGLPPVEMHYISQSVVREIIEANHGRLVDATQRGSVRGLRVGMLYCAVREQKVKTDPVR